MRLAAERRRRFQRCGAAALLALATVLGEAAPARAAPPPGGAVEVRINGRPVAEGVLQGEEVQIPVRAVLSRLGAQVRYDPAAGGVRIRRGSVELLLRPGSDVLVRAGVELPLGSAAQLREGRLLAPARPVIEALGDGVAWNPQAGVLEVESEYARRLERAGRLPTAADEPEAPPPQAPRVPFTEEDVQLLMQLVSAEAWGEPIEGMVAIAAVVINRVLSPRFPDTIREVVRQPGQFPPMARGGPKRIHPQAREAVMRALYGEDPSRGALYFTNPRVDGMVVLKNRTITARIGRHVFAR